MPYLKKRDIAELKFVGNMPEKPGELNYLITKTCLDYLSMKNECYQTYNDVIGALECAKQEFYFRKVRPWEDKKLKENGDVY